PGVSTSSVWEVASKDVDPRVKPGGGEFWNVSMSEDPALTNHPSHPHRAAAVAALDVVERLFEPARLAVFPVEEGRQIGGVGIDQRVGADPDQAESGRAVGLRGEQVAGGGEQGGGGLAP